MLRRSAIMRDPRHQRVDVGIDLHLVIELWPYRQQRVDALCLHPSESRV